LKELKKFQIDPKGDRDDTALSKGEAFLAEILRSFKRNHYIPKQPKELGF
jgi:hypothetical protein